MKTTSQTRPSFMDSPYFVEEPFNWHLTEDAPDELKKEFVEYMNQSGTNHSKPVEGLISKWLLI